MVQSLFGGWSRGTPGLLDCRRISLSFYPSPSIALAVALTRHDCVWLSRPALVRRRRCGFPVRGFCPRHFEQLISDVCFVFAPSIIFVNPRVSKIPTIFMIHLSMDFVILSNCHQIIQYNLYQTKTFWPSSDYFHNLNFNLYQTGFKCSSNFIFYNYRE